MGNLLFSPNGTINRGQFVKAAIVLLALNFFMWLAWFGGLGLGMLAGLASLGLIYSWFAVFAKRFRDAGKSPAWFILVFVVYVVVAYILASIFMAIMAAELFTPEAIGELEAARDLDPNDPQALSVMMGAINPVIRAIAVPYAIGFLVAGGAIAFGVNALLKSKPDAQSTF